VRSPARKRTSDPNSVKCASLRDRVLITTGDSVDVETLGALGIISKRYAGEMIERTAKRLRRSSVGLELWPESTDPKYQTPIPYNENDGDEVEIIGKVLYVLRKV